ncbi:DUF4129 domain-containing transglutaminase family protein [Aquibacillus saliphilus]|uniref:DUF4129 domain-containing transglutaminase family protein n=1 Tax=Aquibacillus saliphilus TaxID=1909422 RepID=UPI001CEFF94A|nr:transglutaminase domain-containing protein [Aquibacillus saliphilus]
MVRSSLNQSAVTQYIVYICGFLLFWEWLRPLESITDTGNLVLFVLYAAFCFFISMLKVNWWLSVPLKLSGIVILIDGLFLTEPIFSSAWFHLWFLHLQFNLEMIVNRQWVDMTPLFRSLLFLLLLWTMSYLLYYWFVVAKRIFLFVLLTFIYITVLDTFTTYQADVAIVRTFIVSLVAMGISSFSREMDRESINYENTKNTITRIVPILVLIACLTIIGIILPKHEPKWADPVPYLTSTAEYAGVGGNGGDTVVQKAGYGENDSRLGGSFIQDYTPVFRAAVQESHYWRIETKDRYSGKGWESSEELNYQEQPAGEISLHLFQDTVDTTEKIAMVSFEADAHISKLVYPYGIQTVSSNYRVQYLLDQETEAIVGEGPEEEVLLNSYQLRYNYPSFSINQLMESGDNDPSDIQEKYLQLPENLPKRVGDLAERVVADDETRYDKVTTIEQYFNRNGFVYQTDEVSVPDQQEDYVDQFLFETKVGYCDNFSTSMVVMLRTLGIPARWVKGFTSGEMLVGEDKPGGVPSDMEVYEISNSNAHSWVEVYFPDVGWVPFEPTQGFSNPVDFYQEQDQTEETETESVAEQDEEEENEEDFAGNFQDFPEDFEQELAGNSGAKNYDTSRNWIVIISGVVVLILASLSLYLTRYRFMSLMMIRKYKNKNGVVAAQKEYHYLLKLLDHKGYKREKGQTLREYARFVDRELQTTDMSRFTYFYERMIYRNEQDSSQNKQITELWENLIRQSLS